MYLFSWTGSGLTGEICTCGMEEDTPVMMVDMVSTVVIPAGGGGN